MVFGMAAGLLYAYAAERLSQTFTDPKGVEKYLELPVLVTVPLKKD
jgi:capsular polysaccharide biosynthesis protein